NAKQLRKRLVNEGSLFQTSSDTEVILHLIAKSQKTTQVEQIKEALSFLEGSYSLVILTDDKLFGARDPYGFRPMCLGKINGSYIITSETCALDINSAEYVRDIVPGEIISIEYDDSKKVVVNSYLPETKLEYKHCVFEYIYFSRPDSKVFGVNVDKLRRKLGKVLAQNHPVTDPDGDKVIVISVPDSSNTAALGYQNQLKKMGIESRYELGLIRSHYIGRTFITPSQKKREVGVKIKFNIVKGVLEGKTIVLVDDSIVRGTTSKQLIRLLREAKPKSIHVRISSPTIISPCYYGMDFPSKEELIANKYGNDVERIRDYMEADSLEYLTNDELLDAMIDHEPSEFCTACFSGVYPVKVNMEITKDEYDD
ncbi:MAG: amidophosphoribosyltransferase, partial [Melioribacteraceae bacterium]